MSNSISKNGNYAIEAQNLSIHYGDFLAVKDVNLKIEKQKITRHYRTFGLRKKHRAAGFQPHERTRAHRLGAKAKCFTTGRTSTMKMSILWKCAAALGWFSRNLIHFPKSIYENVAWGARINGFKGDMDELVE